MSALEPGDLAPDFGLRDQFGQDVSMSAFRGRKVVVLVFYPFAFSGVCASEMSGFQERLDEFVTFDSELLAVSCDPVYALRAFADRDRLHFPLLSDFWPHGEVTRAYGVMDERKGCPRRSTYVVDKQGTVRWAVHNESSDGRDLGEHLAQVRAWV